MTHNELARPQITNLANDSICDHSRDAQAGGHQERGRIVIVAQVLPKASDLPDTQLTLLAFVFAGVFLLGYLLTRAFSTHLTKVIDTSSSESEKDRQLHREVSHGLIEGLHGVTLSVGGLKDDIGKHGRRIDKLAVAITGKLADDESDG